MSSQDDKRPSFTTASDRNKFPILEHLQHLLPRSGTVLEIGSGWAQHAVYFCQAMPGWTWQPSEHPDAMRELEQRLAAAVMPAINSALPLDVLTGDWPTGRFDSVYSANTAHIMSWSAVCAMFAGVGGCLASEGLFCLYGPFNIDGSFTSPGNEAFDLDLRLRNPEMGIRDLEALESLALCNQMKLQQRISMPANNFLLVFRACGN